MAPPTMVLEPMVMPTEAVDTLVISPLPLTVMMGTTAPDPKVPVVALTVAKVSAAGPGPVAVPSPVSEVMADRVQACCPTTLPETNRQLEVVPPTTGVTPMVMLASEPGKG